ncbi:hypothetical protein [Streptomyces decoyicus]|uniref:hypothetical protein n=1 Tax=Streptomyces decoyicus TaxID=249567 RepID=UPI0038635280
MTGGRELLSSAGLSGQPADGVTFRINRALARGNHGYTVAHGNLQHGIRAQRYLLLKPTDPDRRPVWLVQRTEAEPGFYRLRERYFSTLVGAEDHLARNGVPRTAPAAVAQATAVVAVEACSGRMRR